MKSIIKKWDKTSINFKNKNEIVTLKNLNFKSILLLILLYVYMSILILILGEIPKITDYKKKTFAHWVSWK